MERIFFELPEAREERLLAAEYEASKLQRFLCEEGGGVWLEEIGVNGVCEEGGG
jgi:hypothetical protein